MHTNRLITPRPLIVLFQLMLLLFLPKGSQAQNAPKPVAEWLESCRAYTDFTPVAPFKKTLERSDLQQVVENASVLNLDPNSVAALLEVSAPALRFAIPSADGEIELELVQVEILTPDFFVSTDVQDQVAVQKAIHYRGILRGDPNSIACLTVSESGLMGMMANESGAYELGEMEDGSGNYIYYKTQQLKALSPNVCHSDEESLIGDTGGETGADDRGVGCKMVQVYFECDYKLYTDKGSNTTQVSNYVTGLFNQVATLYANDNVGIAISQIFVWTSPDPYSGYNSTSAVLNAFRQTRGTSFNGNLAHLLSTRSLGGGIAYVDVVCFKQYAYGVSAITNSFQNVPTYSWSVEVVTHELGHNLGSWHTHSCNWPTGALDNCVNPEGSCAPGPPPSNGGTIMSYCHLTGNGINFNHGFGPAPGARIRDKVLNGSCLPQSGSTPLGLSSANITNNSAIISWMPVAGATTYTVQYKLSTAGSWITAGNTTAATYTLVNLTANSAYQWKVKTDCSNYSNTASFTTTNSGGGGGGNNCNAPTGLSTVNITSSSAVLFWNTVSGATNYTVQYKLSTSSLWVVAGSTASVSLTLNNLSAAKNYHWRVMANCSTWSSTANFTTANGGGGGGGVCNKPENLTNNTIGSSHAAISWSPVSGATNYTLQIKLASGNNWFTLGSVSVTNVVVSGLQANTLYHWRVKANCSDYSNTKELKTSVNFNGDHTANFSQPFLTEGTGLVALELFPNPATEVLNLRFTGDITAESQLVIQETTGRILSTQTFQNSLDISAYAPGIYFLSLMENGRKIQTARFVKIK
jgi:hypothetical protein